jgi:hypothetical protein
MSDPITLVLLFLFLKGKAGGSSSKAEISSPSHLLQRATQPEAMAWVPYFQDVGETPAVADGLARWTGLESGGDATIISSLGERGLLQVGTQTIKEGGITQADWDDLAKKDTLPNEHARIAAGYWRWLFLRAATHLDNPPNGSDQQSQLWYAYLYHQRPKDFTQWGTIPSKASDASSYLMARSKLNNDPALAKRVTAADIVAWGRPNTYTGLV